MKHYNITRPIGLLTPCEEIESTCAQAHLYRRCGLRPKHYIIPLDAGSGRTTLVEYMAARYREAGVLPFSSGLDDYIEVTFDGTLQQLKGAFATIDAAAVYTNEYRGIVGMDISGLSTHLGETQLGEFLKNCKRVCDHACVIFFVHAAPNRNEEKLLEKLGEAIDDVRRLTVEPYTEDDLCALVVKAVTEHGIEIRHGTLFRMTLTELIAAFHVTGVEEAIAAADALVHFADFSGFVPTVDESSVKAMLAHWQADTERGEVK